MSPAWDFLITITGMSYVLWNPFIFAIFNVHFQFAAKEFIREEVRAKPALTELIQTFHTGASFQGAFSHAELMMKLKLFSLIGRLPHSRQV